MWLLLMPVLNPVRAQMAWEHTSFAGADIVEQALFLDPGLRAGVLRIVISGTLSPNWRVRLDYGVAGTLTLDAENAKARTVRRDAKSTTLDVPLVPGVAVAAKSDQADISVRVLEAITLSGTYGEQMIGESGVASLGPSASNEDIRAASALARLELLTSSGELLGLCTAFRLTRGYWMTAAHCAYRDASRPDAPVIAQMRIQLGSINGRVDTERSLMATAVASGIKNRPVTSNSQVLPTDLDYVILETADDPGGAIIVIDRSVDAAKDTQLALFQYWSGQLPPAAGMAKSEGNSCRVLGKRDPPYDFTRPDLCPGAIQHGCSSQGGASGGPLLSRKDHKLVALHYGAGKTSKFNCGIPTAQILADFCQSTPTLSHKVLPCP
ncbi:MAG: trypsin-like peptidase domain-containing protein [Polaromonas sp.]